MSRTNFFGRFITYQGERFPFLKHAPLILVFTFSSVSYSRACRGVGGFIDVLPFLIGAATAVGFFLLLRIADEFKDFEEDSRYRPYRAVPRGLVTLRELGWLGLAVAIGLAILNGAVMPVMLAPMAIVLAWQALMTREFFLRELLKKRPVMYLLSHMLVMPMIDFYTTGLDWIRAGEGLPTGLEFFLVVSFLNGIVIEIGRKIRANEDEEVGVDTYSALYGAARATWIWIGVLAVTGAAALAAAWFAGFALEAAIALLLLFAASAAVATAFIRRPSTQGAGRIETFAGVWTIGMYLTLGVLPMVVK